MCSCCKWERATGEVVRAMKADGQAVNGVVPHPALPLFASYGLDSLSGHALANLLAPYHREQPANPLHMPIETKPTKRGGGWGGTEEESCSRRPLGAGRKGTEDKGLLAVVGSAN